MIRAASRYLLAIAVLSAGLFVAPTPATDALAETVSPDNGTAADSSETFTPVIRGVAVVGSTLAVNAPSGHDNVTYQWYRDGRGIHPITDSPQYYLTSYNLGAEISVLVRVWSGNELLWSKTAEAVGPVLQKLSPTIRPAISGTAVVGSTLTANPGKWGPAPVSYRYQWYRDGQPIPGATAKTYKLHPANFGKRITVTVMGVKSGYKRVTRVSYQTPAVQGAISMKNPTIDGPRRTGYRLTANEGTTSPNSVDYSYQWYRNGQAIAGETSSDYYLEAGDATTRIHVKVTARKSGYRTVGKFSAKTAAIAYQYCSTARAAGAAPVYAWEPGYGAHLDRDGDGVGCEWN